MRRAFTSPQLPKIPSECSCPENMGSLFVSYPQNHLPPECPLFCLYSLAQFPFWPRVQEAVRTLEVPCSVPFCSLEPLTLGSRQPGTQGWKLPAPRAGPGASVLVFLLCIAQAGHQHGPGRATLAGHLPSALECLLPSNGRNDVTYSPALFAGAEVAMFEKVSLNARGPRLGQCKAQGEMAVTGWM